MTQCYFHQGKISHESTRLGFQIFQISTLGIQGAFLFEQHKTRLPIFKQHNNKATGNYRKSSFQPLWDSFKFGDFRGGLKEREGFFTKSDDKDTNRSLLVLLPHILGKPTHHFRSQIYEFDTVFIQNHAKINM